MEYHSLLEESKSLWEEMKANRRALHQKPEVLFELPNTLAYLENKLREYGYLPQRCGKSGLVCTIGVPGKTFLLRSDMDGLPGKEETGLPFTSQTDAVHACGHDMHMAMLLGAAQLLKRHEHLLKGTVKLMFQPAEEMMLGANDMLENGLLENPPVDMAMNLHVLVGNEEVKTGELKVIQPVVCRSGDVVHVRIKGRSVHSSVPEQGIDANSIGAKILGGFESIIANEIPRDCPTVITTGRMDGGSATNTIPGECVLGLGIRTSDPQVRLFILDRIREISHHMAAAFRATAVVEHDSGAPPVVNHKAACEELCRYIGEVIGPEHIHHSQETMGIGEDFGVILEKVPGMYAFIGAGAPSEGYTGALHAPNVLFNEETLYYGAAIEAHTAIQWLVNNS